MPPPSAGGADRARIEKELAQAEAALEATRARLADATFLDRAPAAIVEGARAREAELAERVRRLEESPRPLNERSPRRRRGRGSCPPYPEGASALDGAAGDAADEVPLQGEEDGERQGHRQECRGGQEVGLPAERADEVRDPTVIGRFSGSGSGRCR